MSEWAYKYGKWEGLRTHWYENGQIFSKDNYKNGVEHGLHTSWESNGNIDSEKNYINGVENGKWTDWFLGIKYKEEFYENGIMVDKKCWNILTGYKEVCDDK